jgi:hypothetical protein
MVQLLRFYVGPARRSVQNQPAADQLLSRGEGGLIGARAAENGADAGYQLVGIEGPVEVVVGAF